MSNENPSNVNIFWRQDSQSAFNLTKDLNNNSFANAECNLNLMMQTSLQTQHFLVPQNNSIMLESNNNSLAMHSQLCTPRQGCRLSYRCNTNQQCRDNPARESQKIIRPQYVPCKAQNPHENSAKEIKSKDAFVIPPPMISHFNIQ